MCHVCEVGSGWDWVGYSTDGEGLETEVRGVWLGVELVTDV